MECISNLATRYSIQLRARMLYGTTEGFHEYGNSWFNNRDNEDAYNMFRSYNNEYYRGDDAEEEFDDGGDVEI